MKFLEDVAVLVLGEVFDLRTELELSEHESIRNVNPKK